MKHKIFILICICFLGQYAMCQDIKDFKIYVTKDKLSSITCHSEIDNYYIQEKNTPYRVSSLGDDEVIIQTAQQTAEISTLIIKEGQRQHKFILTYKDTITSPDELDYNFKDIKNLDKIIANYKNREAIINALPDSDPVAVSSNNNTSDNNFYSLISDGDNAKKDQQYDEAKDAYQKALQIKPGNDYATVQLKEVDSLINKKINNQFDEIVTKANNYFSEDNLEEAYKLYSQALVLKPGNAFAAGQIVMINKKRADAKAEIENKIKDSSFNNYVNSGNNSLNDKLYDAARIAFMQALNIKPNDATVLMRLKMLDDQIQADSLDVVQKRSDDQYNSYVNIGNKALSEKSYQIALNAYNEAIKIKPGDTAAGNRIYIINNQIKTDSLNAEQQKQKDLYNNLINEGNIAMRQKSYEAARNAFNQALSLNPDGKDAKTQLLKIDDVLKKLEDSVKQEAALFQQKQKQNKYDSVIALANQYFEAGLYTNAKEEYNKALSLNNNPATRIKIKQTDSILNTIEAKALLQKEKERQDSVALVKFNKAKGNADSAFEKGNYTAAKTAYLNALKYKDDNDVKIKIEEINANEKMQLALKQAAKDSIAKQQQDDKKYLDLVKRAKDAFNKSDYATAKSMYLAAAVLKPSNEEPKAQIALINKTETDIENSRLLQIQMDSLDEAASVALANNNFESALQNYRQMLPDSERQLYASKQIIYINERIRQRDSVAAVEKRMQDTNSKDEELLKKYKKANDAVKALDFTTALINFKQFDSLATVFYDSGYKSRHNLKNMQVFSQSKIHSIEDFLLRQSENLKATDSTIKTIAPKKVQGYSTAVFYPNPKDPKLRAIYAKYRNIDFNVPPPNQKFDALDISYANSLLSRKLMAAVPELNIADSANGVKMICQNINFDNAKVYFKFLVQNEKQNEFLTGKMQLIAYDSLGNAKTLLPVYISGFPIILPGQEKLIVYVVQFHQVSPNEHLNFEMEDRLGKEHFKVFISGVDYNLSRP